MPKKRRIGDTFWMVVINDSNGSVEVTDTYDEGNVYDLDSFLNGNYFNTKEDAEEAANQIREVLNTAAEMTKPVPVGEYYYAIMSCGGVHRSEEKGDNVSEMYRRIGNYYHSLEDAKEAEQRVLNAY